MSKFCEEANIKFKTQPLDPDIRSIHLEMAKRRHILLILKESLNNSVRHGKPSEIELICTLFPNKVSIELTDNGKGFEVNKESNGNGLQNIKFRAEQIGGKLAMSSEPNEGSKIILELNISKE